MNEMTLLRDLGRELAPDDLGLPPALRERSLPAPRPARRVWLTHRVPVLAAAAAVTAALVVAPGLVTGTRNPGPPSAAAAVLERAAGAAADDPVLTVPPGGFVYTESVERSEVDTITGGVQTAKLGPLTDRRTWRSPDGRRPGLLQERRHGHGAWTSVRLDAPDSPALRTGLPTGTTAMLRWIHAHDDGQNPRDVQALTTVGDTLRESYVSPRSVAAMFRAAARIPGTTVVRDLRDSLGRPVVAIRTSNRVASLDLLFDPGTFVYLGDQAVLTKADVLGPVGTVVGSYAVVRTAAATRAGTVPE